MLAHTLNWIFNAHFWDFGRFLGITRTSPDVFIPYIRKISQRLGNRHSVMVVLIIGSISRGQILKETSDIDMIFIRSGGIKNAFNAVLVTMLERIIAFFNKFPLHLELYDSIDEMRKHRNDEVPVLLKDEDGRGQNWYAANGRSTVYFQDIAT